MRGALWPFCVALLASFVFASDYTQCMDLDVSVNSTTIESQPACLEVNLASDCEMHLRFTLGDRTLLSGSIDVEISRTMCTSYGACDICIDVNDFYLHPSTNESQSVDADVCLSVSTRHCLVSSLDVSQDFGCFTILHTQASECGT